jgi:hypothetical protein
MKVDYLEKQLLLIGFLAQDCLRGVAALVKEVFTRTRVYGDEEHKISYWQLIFLQSKVNGCSYRDEDLPHMKWQWPRDTWFQEQLSHQLTPFVLFENFDYHQASGQNDDQQNTN